jgi:hypothetical protein
MPHDRIRSSASSNLIRRSIGEITRSEYVSGAPEIAIAKEVAGSRRGSQPVPAAVGPLPVSLSVLALIGVVFIASLVGFRAEAAPRELGWTPPLSGLALFAVLTILAENIAVDVFGRGKTSVTVMLILGASFLYGPLGSLTTVLAFAACTRVKMKNPPHRMRFNFGMALFAAEVGTIFFQLIGGGTVDDQPVEVLIFVGAGAGLVYYAINHTLVSLVRSLTEGRNAWQIWSEHYQWLWPHYIVLGTLSAVVALGYRYLGAYGLIALASLVAMMRLAIKQYVARTAIYVSELERMTA